MMSETYAGSEGFQKIICLHCLSSLGKAVFKDHYLICQECGTAYPLVEGQTPVLMAQAHQELADAFLLYDKHIREEQQSIQRMEETGQTVQSKIAAGLLQMAEARRQNVEHFLRLQQAVRPFISIESLMAAFYRNTNSSYGLVLGYYLEKDWSGLPDAEAEIATRIEAVLKANTQYAPDLGSALVLGAGAGRVAWEMGYLYKHVYAVDNSLIMPYHFCRLQQEDITFYDVNANNVLHPQYRVREMKASLKASSHSPTTFEANAARITYFMGDVTQLPLPEQSQSAVVSVYFTDVLPLSSYLPEIRRVLKPGGVFIHFGPLVYHFRDESQMLAPDEVMDVFQQQGFTVHAHTFMTDKASTFRGTMISTNYTNWLFTATYQPQASKVVVSPHSVLSLTSPLCYEIHGLLKGQEEMHQTVRLTLPWGEKFKISTLMLDLLHQVNGERSVTQVLSRLEESYDLPEEYQVYLLATLQQLLDKKVITLSGSC